MSGKEKTKATRHDVEIIKIRERERTIRTGIICGSILIGIGIIAVSTCWAVVQLNQPPWLKLLLVLIAVIGALPVPAVWIWRIRRNYRRFIEENYQRQVDLERRIDPGRSSTNLRSNGSKADDI